MLVSCMKWFALLASVVGASAPVAETAAPARSCPRCARVVFIEHMPWRAFDARGARWNPIAAPAIKSRLLDYARGPADAFKRACQRDEFSKKVCRAAKKCAIAGGITLWTGIETGQSAWTAEMAGFNACWAAIISEFAE
jgi:hypothetical protein